MAITNTPMSPIVTQEIGRREDGDADAGVVGADEEVGGDDAVEDAEGEARRPTWKARSVLPLAWAALGA